MAEGEDRAGRGRRRGDEGRRVLHMIRSGERRKKGEGQGCESRVSGVKCPFPRRQGEPVPCRDSTGAVGKEGGW